MISIQNHLRNEGLLNLFDGRSVAPRERTISWEERIDPSDRLFHILRPIFRDGVLIVGGGSGCSKTDAPET